jgi:CRP/FNR family cyclic AMP-dependent transcriptional regulator
MDPALHPEAKRFLLSIAVFGALPDRAADKLLDLIEVRRHHPGEVVCGEGEPGRQMFVVRSGSVEVTKRAQQEGPPTPLARLVAGDCFGEMSLIDIQRRSATVTAREDTELYVLSNKDFYTLYTFDPEAYTLVVMNICREVSRRLRNANNVIAGLLVRVEEYLRSNRDYPE